MLWSLDDAEKVVGTNYGALSEGWKHYQVQIKPSKYDKQLTFSSAINSVNGSIGFDNIVFNTQKKCIPKWNSLYGYKFHPDIATDDFYNMMFQPRYLFPH